MRGIKNKQTNKQTNKQKHLLTHTYWHPGKLTNLTRQSSSSCCEVNLCYYSSCIRRDLWVGITRTHEQPEILMIIYHFVSNLNHKSWSWNGINETKTSSFWGLCPSGPTLRAWPLDPILLGLRGKPLKHHISQKFFVILVYAPRQQKNFLCPVELASWLFINYMICGHINVSK